MVNVVVSLKKSYEYSVSGTHYRVEAERPSCQTRHYAIGQCCVQGFKLNHMNVMFNSSIIPDPTEVSEVFEEATVVDKKELGEEELKEDLGTLGDERFPAISCKYLFLCLV